MQRFRVFSFYFMSLRTYFTLSNVMRKNFLNILRFRCYLWLHLSLSFQEEVSLVLITGVSWWILRMWPVNEKIKLHLSFRLWNRIQTVNCSLRISRSWSYSNSVPLLRRLQAVIQLLLYFSSQIDREKTIFHYFELCARIESEGSPAKIKDDFLVVLSIIPVFVRNKNKSRFGK